MSRSFDMSAEYNATVEQVHSAFNDEDYWLARLEQSGVDIATLDSMTTHPDGSVEIKTTQGFRRDRIPGWVFQFYRGDVHIVREERWSPIGGGEAHAEVVGSVPGAPASLSGKAALRPHGSGSRLEFSVTVEVNIPLVGGKIEDFIGGKLAELVIAEQRFTTVWIAENA
jgi:Protein of unknown function (DUF2505)